MATDRPTPPRGSSRRSAPPRWLDEDAGPVVRPYALTGGRVRPTTGDLDLVAFIVAQVPAGGPLPEHLPPEELQPEHHAIINLTQQPATVADIAAALGLPLGVVRILLGDLIRHKLVALQEPAADRDAEDVLKAVISGLRAL